MKAEVVFPKFKSLMILYVFLNIWKHIFQSYRTKEKKNHILKFSLMILVIELVAGMKTHFF